MNIDLFESLLYEEESATLDFKIEQYRFSKASEDDKSELLKDILGFCNAWRRGEAYILMGVEEVRGGRSRVVGIPSSEHLDDHALQQFVNNLTNQPVRFHYEAFGFEGMQVGVLRIEEQQRPIYLKRDYGRLKRDTVYVRRGSSTDLTKPASLEEIARMGSGSREPACELVVEFAEIERDVALGTRLSLDAEYCAVPAQGEIPDLEEECPGGLYGGLMISNPLNRVNSSYFRELAQYEFARRLMRPIRIVMSNVGQVAARNVQIDIEVPRASCVAILDRLEYPDKPNYRFDHLFLSPITPLSAELNREPGRVTISRNEERYRAEIDCGDLQPGRMVWSAPFYLESAESGSYTLQGKIFADNLPKPKEIGLVVAVTISHTTLSVDELCTLRRQRTSS